MEWDPFEPISLSGSNPDVIQASNIGQMSPTHLHTGLDSIVVF